ncbi:MAG: histidine kinase [Thermoleophilia bacterium]
MTGLRRALAGLGLLGAVWAGFSVALVLSSDHQQQPGLITVLKTAVGVVFIAVGLFVWDRRPDNRMGAILTAVGFSWFLMSLPFADSEGLHTAGLVIGHVSLPLAFTLLAFPTGHLVAPADRLVVAAAWVWATLLSGAVALIDRNPPDQPRNLIAVTDVDWARPALELAGAGLAAAVLVALALRWRAATAPERNELLPILVTGGAAAALYGVWLGVYGEDATGVAPEALQAVTLAAMLALALSFVVGLYRARVLAGRAVRRLVAELSAPLDAHALRDRMAAALGDPGLELLFARPGGGWVDAAGRPSEPPSGPDRAWSPIVRDGRAIAGIAHDPALSRGPEMVAAVGGAAGLAIDNARLEAQLRARVAEVSASRARLIAAADHERRRLERDLHDGAQQRLVSLALRLRMAAGCVEEGSEAARFLEGAMGELQQALDELRELARGIHPAVLTDRGLPAAIGGLAGRAPLPVDVDAPLLERLPEPVEAAAYFVVAEALTNVARYSSAGSASVRVVRENGHAVVEVRDDGVGGADPARGSGLAGLADRIAALDGRLVVESPPGAGTLVRAEIPCAS